MVGWRCRVGIIIHLSPPPPPRPVLKMISHTVKPGRVGLRLGDHHVLTPFTPSTNRPCLTFAATLRPQVNQSLPPGACRPTTGYLPRHQRPHRGMRARFRAGRLCRGDDVVSDGEHISKDHATAVSVQSWQARANPGEWHVQSEDLLVSHKTDSSRGRPVIGSTRYPCSRAKVARAKAR